MSPRENIHLSFQITGTLCSLLVFGLAIYNHQTIDSVNIDVIFKSRLVTVAAGVQFLIMSIWMVVFLAHRRRSSTTATRLPTGNGEEMNTTDDFELASK
jgi:hypothetical protein